MKVANVKIQYQSATLLPLVLYFSNSMWIVLIQIALLFLSKGGGKEGKDDDGKEKKEEMKSVGLCELVSFFCA